MKRLGLLATAAIVYVLAAWMVAPGFYDGFGPPQPYNWTCPPPQAGANTKPTSGHADIKVVKGKSEASSAFDNDGQIVIGFLPDSFDVTGKTSVSVDVTPLDTCPQPPGVRVVTNVYKITADAPLKQAAQVTLRYSNLEPDPDAIYRTDDLNTIWQSIGKADQAQPFTVTTKTSALGYFAAGYRSAPPSPGVVTVGGGQVLPIIAAVLIVVVVMAGLPLAIVRRRQPSGTKKAKDDS